ncbi:hypothetical protein [Fluviispira vulneris]|uniref:hypothetical protein n=1 Tax=Fluviispira vulneris TaxID=2763012 RepID=UPI0016443EB7|nr:hypothetical protein [Fluviispira vulneris]
MKKIFLIILFPSLISIADIACAGETYVYCADENKNWHWLSGGTITVSGYWDTASVRRGLYFNYFIITKGLDEVKALRDKCVNEFGSNYIFAQPADSSLQRWSLFAINDDTFVSGIVTFLS